MYQKSFIICLLLTASFILNLGPSNAVFAAMDQAKFNDKIVNYLSVKAANNVSGISKKKLKDNGLDGRTKIQKYLPAICLPNPDNDISVGNIPVIVGCSSDSVRSSCNPVKNLSCEHEREFGIDSVDVNYYATSQKNEDKGKYKVEVTLNGLQIYTKDKANKCWAANDYDDRLIRFNVNLPAGYDIDSLADTIKNYLPNKINSRTNPKVECR